MILDPFQQQAIDYINQGLSVLVSAPTGAGKTVIAEHVIRDCLARDVKVIYTAPIKALSNQKYRDFCSFDWNRPDAAVGAPTSAKRNVGVGIMTGDITLNPRAPVLIMTTEIFRNKILEDRSSLDDYAWAIFDEIHYLDDFERGTVWEESLIFLPEHMKLLGLSATVPNIDEIRLWLESIHNKPFKVVKESKRPVPLHFFFQCQDRIYKTADDLIRNGFTSSTHHRYRAERLPDFVRTHPNPPSHLIEKLRDKDLLPCIFFAFSRRRTEELAGQSLDYNFLLTKETETITGLFNDLCDRFDLRDEPSAEEVRPLIERGIAYHHAGMLPTLKEVIERIFTSRLLKVIFTTETFALGINMPARSVVFDELRKYYGRSAFDVLRTRDFYQMAGRAGRRGIDDEGFVFLRVNPCDITPEELKKMLFGEPEKVCSQFNASYATVLNLYQHYGEKLYDVYPKSLHYFQKRRFLRQQAVYFLEGKVNILKELGYIKDETLTTKGIFASKVYGYELILSEMFDSGLLEKLPGPELAALALAAVFEPRKGTAKPDLHKKIQALEDFTNDIVRRIQKLEKVIRLPDLSKRCNFHLTPALEAWIRQQDFHDILKLTQVDEGEVVRYMRMAIQLLRQMIEGPVSDEFRQKVSKVIVQINRGVIDSEKQLRS